MDRNRSNLFMNSAAGIIFMILSLKGNSLLLPLGLSFLLFTFIAGKKIYR